jgi:uncharacterized protein YdcH (DUF465 family)
MGKDYLQLFNTKLVKTILQFDDVELWDFLTTRIEQIRQLEHRQTVCFYGLPHSVKRFQEMFEDEVKEDRNGLLYTIINDLCFEGETVNLDFYEMSGFLDHSNSCDAVKHNQIMPEIDEESEAAFHERYFYLLEPGHLDNIIKTLQKNVQKLDDSSIEGIKKIKLMKKTCVKQDFYKTALVYKYF